jgi:hypothetical protein
LNSLANSKSLAGILLYLGGAAYFETHKIFI